MSLSLVFAVGVATMAFSAPQFLPPPPPGLPMETLLAGTCAINQSLAVPANQTILATPVTPPSFALLGVGMQNYTCNSTTGTYASVGAVADLYDLSCLSVEPSEFGAIQDDAFAAWTAIPINATSLGPNATDCLQLMGQHYFAPSPSGVGISPVWDLRAASAECSDDAFVVGAKVGNIPAPTGPKDIDWLQLKSVSGSLATSVYRVDTRGGQPPATCIPGSAPISVKYTSKYWLFGNAVTV